MSDDWHIDEDSGCLVCNTIHHMGRRCRNWDYYGFGAYHITLTLADRTKPLFGKLTAPAASAQNGPASTQKVATIALTELGRQLEHEAWNIGDHHPEVRVLGVQVMPEHVHIVLTVIARMTKPLGNVIGGFKGGVTSIYRRLCALGAGAPSLWSDGFVDTILNSEEEKQAALVYLADNPRRAWEKRQHPELFKVLRDIEHGGMHFAAIGNAWLLKQPTILQVQCSRRFTRDTPEFCEKRDTLLAAAKHGAVLISPCISEGEREIARLAYEQGYKVITLKNKGFSPLYKPGGKLFDQCAAGNLLMLAPTAWPYQPGEKRLTREDCCIMNRIAQIIAGKNAIEIQYKGLVPNQLESMVALATK